MDAYKTRNTQKRYIVISPQEIQGREIVGSYAEQYGWAVRDTHSDPSIGQMFWHGNRSMMRKVARDLNRKVPGG